jgi:hypothetical protein
MNRRDFLSLRVGPRGQTVELSAERLFMRCLDSRVGLDRSASDEVWDGEPPAVLDRRTPDDLLRDVADHLRHASVLRIAGREWLANDLLQKPFDDLISAFLARGGQVEFTDRSTGS